MLSNFFTLQKILKAGALVFSFLFIILSIQVFANITQIAKTVVTKRNGAIIFISSFLIIVSVLLFIFGFLIL